MELFCDRELYTIYAPHFAHKLTAIYLDEGWKYHIKVFFLFTVRSQRFYSKNEKSQGKSNNLVLIVSQWHHISCGGSGSDLKGLKGLRTENAEKDGTSGHPWGEIYRLRMITSLPLSESIATPFVERPNFDGEECKVERDMSGWDGRERQGSKEIKRLHCVSLMVFSKSKWATDEKKEGCSDTVFERRIKKEEMSSIMNDGYFCLMPRQPTARAQSVLMHPSGVTVSLSHFFMLYIQKKVTRLSQWNDVKLTTRSFSSMIRLTGPRPKQ